MTSPPTYLPIDENPWPPVPRVCDHCGRDALSPQRVLETNDDDDDGPFSEKYMCGHCNATGTVNGFEHSPSEWTYSGDAVSDPSDDDEGSNP